PFGRHTGCRRSSAVGRQVGPLVARLGVGEGLLVPVRVARSGERWTGHRDLRFGEGAGREAAAPPRRAAGRPSPGNARRGRGGQDETPAGSGPTIATGPLMRPSHWLVGRRA